MIVIMLTTYGGPRGHEQDRPRRADAVPPGPTMLLFREFTKEGFVKGGLAMRHVFSLYIANVT